MALTIPVYRANGMDITQDEAIWLTNEILDHARRLRALADNNAKRLADMTLALAELVVERDALPQGTERDQLTTAIDRIEKGVNEETKIAVKKFRALAQATPNATNARRFTVVQSYNPDTAALTVTTATPGQMTLAESRWPSLVFSLVDTNADGAVTTAEVAAYYNAL